MIRKLPLALAAFALSIAPGNAAEGVRYELPPGSYPHDVAPGADGIVWYADQMKGLLGGFDPETGKVTQIPLGTGSGPHGVIIGPEGGVWLTDSGLNAIVRVDPAS